IEDDLVYLRREGARISDDARKALILDIKEQVQEGRYKSMTLTVAIAVAILSLLGYIGFESVKHEAAEYVVKSELKEQINSDLQVHMLESQKILQEIKREKKELQFTLSSLMKEIEQKRETLVMMTNLISKYGVTNKDVDSVVPQEMISVIERSGRFAFLKSFGISNQSVLKLLATETEGFDFVHISQESISQSVKQIQARYSLSVDGNLGPCTSLIVGALLLQHYEIETRDELKASSFGSKEWLTKSFQTCNAHDKESLQRVLEYPELPMHSQLNRFVSASKIDHKQLLDSLHVSTPLPPAYKALEQIGYGEQ
ncbi:hypothetical protein WKN17_003732, partial [Vibrio cholerae]